MGLGCICTRSSNKQQSNGRLDRPTNKIAKLCTNTCPVNKFDQVRHRKTVPLTVQTRNVNEGVIHSSNQSEIDSNSNKMKSAGDAAESIIATPQSTVFNKCNDAKQIESNNYD